MPMFRRKPPTDGLRRLWNAQFQDHIIALSWSPASDRLAIAPITGPMVLCAGNTGQRLQEWPGHGFGTTRLTWQPGAERLASAGQDGKIALWSPELPEPIARLDAGAAWAEHLAWHPSGLILASAAGKIVRLWTPDGENMAEFANHPSTVYDLAWRPGTQQLAVAVYGGVLLYDITTTKLIQTLEWKGSPLALTWSANGELLAHGNQDSTVHFWFVKTAKPLQMYGFPTKVRELDFDPFNRFLATGGGAALCVWDCSGPGPEGRKPAMFLNDEQEDLLTGCRWQRLGAKVAATFADGAVKVWQPAAKGQLIGQDRTDEEAVLPTWSPQDRQLAVGSSTGQVVVLEVRP